MSFLFSPLSLTLFLSPRRKKKTKEEKARLTLRDLVERVREAAAPLEDYGVADVGLDGPELLGGWGLQGRDAPVDDDFWFVLFSIGVFIDETRGCGRHCEPRENERREKKGKGG